MISLEELEQFVAFSELGTLSKVAEKYHISSPSLSRAMQHLEDDLGVTLFDRKVNKISLTKTGEKALYFARDLLTSTQEGIEQLQHYEESLKTISIYSVAPKPLWDLLPTLNQLFPGKIISQTITNQSEVFNAISNKKASLAIVSDIYGSEFENLPSKLLFVESLSVVLTKDHELADYKSVTFKDINGYNFLVKSDIGDWQELIQLKMPASKFLIQKTDFEFEELVKSSNLPRFVTNGTKESLSSLKDRVVIPISDKEATKHFSLVVIDNDLKNIL